MTEARKTRIVGGLSFFERYLMLVEICKLTAGWFPCELEKATLPDPCCIRFCE
jgi:ACR3 family arsenite transporter